LKPRRIGQIRMLVQNRWQLPPCTRDPSKCRRPVAVQMQYVDALPIDDSQQGGQSRGIEFRFMQVGDIDARRFQGLLGKVLLPQADERHVELLRVETRDHPCEKPLHSVDPRSFPAEMIANLKDVEGCRRLPVWCHEVAPGTFRRDTIRAGMPTAVAPGGTSSRTTAEAPTIA
jgi:hypothetical protein